TGLVIDAYFSGTKYAWILDTVAGARQRAAQNELAAGTIDSWLLFKLSGGLVHATDYTNASRTLLYNIRLKEWDSELLELFRVPPSILPTVHPSRHRYGVTKDVDGIPDGIPILALIGDQQAALFGQLRVNPGEAKNTYGTGCFLLFNTGDDFVLSQNGLITTLACNAEGQVCYALEGAVFIGGAVVQWLRDYMEFFKAAPKSEKLAQELHNEADEVVFVPAFAGLGAPHWDMQARGAIFGLTRDTSPARITRAALNSIALQSHDLVRAMEQDTGKQPGELRVDGGATSNAYLMQYQADILNMPVIKPANADTTALGSAYLAGLESGFWDSLTELSELQSDSTVIQPSMTAERRHHELKYWNKAVERVKDWVD
ncbi:MAG: glycerol kinase GlpK, partial [Leptospiraceae bacterium]|nr:glycerol kinase GlpK [Leptospiraceae bacterium]